MDTLTSMNVFRQVVDLGSFSKAADYLNISPAMASKHLRHLEDCLQAKLLNRSSRHLSLTEIGQNYYHECCHALDILNSARQTAQQGVVNPARQAENHHADLAGHPTLRPNIAAIPHFVSAG